MRLILSIVVIVVSFLVFFILSYFIKKYASKSSIDYSKSCELKVYNAILSVISRKNVFHPLYFPVHKNGKLLWTEVDLVCLTRGGIVVVEIKGLKGLISNPDGPIWVQNHGEKRLEFQNPYVQNKGHIIAINNVLSKANLANIPVKNVVVFTDSKVRFTNNYKWLCDIDQVVDYVATLEDRDVVNSKDLSRVRKLLSQYQTKHKPTAAIKHK